MGTRRAFRGPDRVLTQIRVLGWGLKDLKGISRVLLKGLSRVLLKGISRVLSRALARGRVSSKTPTKEQAMDHSRDLITRGLTKSQIAGQILDRLADPTRVQDMV